MVVAQSGQLALPASAGGALTMVSPLLIVGWASQRLPAGVANRLGDPVLQLEIVGPVAQAGAAWACT